MGVPTEYVNRAPLPDWIENAKPARRTRWTLWWRRPWTCPTEKRKAWRFKRNLWFKSGKVSPHFTRDEARSHDGKKVPRPLRRGCQKHGFKLERVRHRLGDKPLTGCASWYRSFLRNILVGGAQFSKHVLATATDWNAREHQNAFDRAMEDEFENGGIGKQVTGVSDPYVRHVDNGPTRRWTY